MSDRHQISPEPTAEDRDAVLAAVEQLLKREEQLATQATWRLSARTQQRLGVRDLGVRLDGARRWSLSARMPWGGREFPGLNGRGDAK